MRGALAVVVFALALAGCPSKETDFTEKAAVSMGAFRDRMCACKDKACADKVQEEMMRWSTEMAKRAPRDRPNRNSDEMMKRMTEIGTTYGECMTKIYSEPVAEPPVEPSVKKGDPVPKNAVASLHLPPPSYGTLWADRLLADARTWARAQRTGRTLASATFAYVDRHGALDPADGEVALQFGAVDETETKRKLGGKVKAKPKRDDCFEVSTATGTWSLKQTECVDATEVALHCTVAQIWQRAVEKKAPEEALATITLATSPAPTWIFAIDDEPRKVHILHTFADDCPLAVEK
jgi:hypothetical protein